jgi:Domain of unknown function (DUF3342)
VQPAVLEMGLVTIKVYDEARNTHQNFYCDAQLLTSSMRCAPNCSAPALCLARNASYTPIASMPGPLSVRSNAACTHRLERTGGRRYFRDHLSGRRVADNATISVYCDAAVFAWLLAFTQARWPAEQPQLSHSNAMAVLISSSFLQMERLAPLCVRFVAANLSALLRKKADVGALAEPLLRAIAEARSDRVSPLPLLQRALR